jgi:hypothetical protein
MKPQKKPEYWQFVRLAAREEHWHLQDFQFKNEHAAFAYCMRCKCRVAYSQTSSKVRYHMQRYHAHDMLEFFARKVALEQSTTRNLSDAFAEVAEPEKKRVPRQITAEEQKHVNKLLALWISRHFRPIRIVEDTGFIEFVRYITVALGNVVVNVPRRTKMREEVVSLARTLRERVKKAIESDCGFYSVTSDIWTARNTRSYISCTVHYVTASFHRVNWTLEVRELSGIHDGNAIASALKEIMHDWSLPASRCVKLVRDGGSNMVKAARFLSIDDMSCVAHSMHLVVAGALIKPRKKDALLDDSDAAAEVEEQTPDIDVTINEDDEVFLHDEMDALRGLQTLAIEEMNDYMDTTLSRLEQDDLECVRKIVQRFRSLAVYFRKSPKAHNRLNLIQGRDLGLAKPLSVLVDCPTRWNSCWAMLARLIELRPALHHFFGRLGTTAGRNEFKDVQRKLFQPKEKDWFAILCLKSLLAPFASASTKLGGQSYPTSPLVMPALASVRRQLSDRGLFDEAVAAAGHEEYVDETVLMMNECRKRILTLFDERFSGLKDTELMWVAFLDPRIGRRMAHLNPVSKERAVADVLHACFDLARVYWQDDSRSADEFPFHEARPTIEGDVTNDMFGEDMDEQPVANLERNCEDEFSLYLTEARTVKKADDPFEWWRVNRHKYPNLSRLARKWLGVVATSVPSERAFSTSGNVVTVKRSSLAPDMVSDLVFVAENLRDE